jgi:hypothetical protein
MIPKFPRYTMRHEKNAQIQPDEQLIALLGLAARKPQPQGLCPTEEQLSAFIDGRLSLPQRKAILAHLNACEQCYREWLEAALILSELPQATPKQSWWHKLSQAWRGRPWIMPLAAALACLAVVVIVTPLKPAQETWQISQLAAMVSHHPGLDQALAALPRELESTNLAFSDTPQNPAKQAFAAGFQQARHWFDGTYTAEAAKPAEAWQGSPWQDYYDLGQWAFLTWVLAQTEGVNAEEWRLFERYCQTLIARFAQKSQDPMVAQVLAALREIHAVLGTLAQQPDPAQQVRLVRKLRLTVQQFLS